jgi:predicted nuclease with RNAse H fold
MSTVDADAPLTPEEEAVLKEFLERGLERYAALATPEMMATMREVGADGMRTHPAMRRFIRRLAARPAPQRSGEVERDGAGAPDAEKGGKGGA